MRPEIIWVGAVIWATLSLGAALAVYQYLLQPTFADYFRQDLFQLRFDLFMFMAQGRIAPNHPAYTQLRNALNGMLRFAERVHLVRILISASVVDGAEYLRRFEIALATLDEKTRAELMQFHARLGEFTGKHLLRTSPVFWLLVVILVPIEGLSRLAKFVAKVLAKPLLSLEAEATDEYAV